MIRIALHAAIAIALALLHAPAAHAQLFRAYLSVAGSDTNPCTLSSPCRLLPAAMNAVADKGEVWMLDSANFNGDTVNVTKSVTILAVPGAVGSVVATRLFGVGINVATGVTVTLRNLVVGAIPGFVATTGVIVTNGGKVHFEDCVVTNLATGISVSQDGWVNLRNTIVRGNTTGMRLLTPATAIVTGSQFTGNVTGLSGAGVDPGSIHGGFNDTVFSDNDTGVLGTGKAGTSVFMHFNRTSILGSAQVGLKLDGDGSAGRAQAFLNEVVFYEPGPAYAYRIIAPSGVAYTHGNNMRMAGGVEGTLQPIATYPSPNPPGPF